MRKSVAITEAESKKIYRLYTTHMSYMSMLQFLSNSEVNSAMYDKKWDEAVQLNIQLDEAKREIEKKYKPAGDWDRFEFNFDNQQVVFVKNETT